MAIPSLIFLYFIYDAINFQALVIVTIAAFLVGGILEIWAVKQGRKDKFYIWEYSNKTTLGKKIMGIAVEDLFVFLTVTPIFIISAWEFIKRMMSKGQIEFNSVVILGVISVFISYFVVFRLTRPR